MKKPPNHRLTSVFSFVPASNSWKRWTLLVAATCLAASQSISAITGNYYEIGNANSAGVSPVNSQWVTFTAQENSTISEAQINNSADITGAPVLEVGLYAVNGSGIPTGPALSSSTISPSGLGWHAAALDYALVKGTVYALRVSTTTVGTSYLWRLNFALSGNVLQPSGAVDSHWLRGINSSDPVGTSQNVWILKTGTNQAIGQPYTSTPSQGVGSTAVAIGQRFRFDLPSSGESLLESVSLKLNIDVAPPTNPLTVKLLDQNGNVLTSGSLDLSSAAAGPAYFTIDFVESQALTSGEFYYLAVYSNNSVGKSAAWMGGQTTNDALYQSATYQGTEAYAVTWNSQSTLGTPTTTDLSRDYFFQLNLGAVPEPSTWALLGIGGMVWLLATRRRRLSGH